jgi:hypothetical protein
LPLISDFSLPDDEDFQRPPSGDSLSQVSGSMPSAAPTTPTVQKPSGDGSSADTAGAVPWERFVSANKDVSDREAGKLTANVQGQVDRAEQGREDASAAHSAAVDSNYSWSGKGEGGFGDSSVGGFGDSEIQQKPIHAGRQLSEGPGSQTVGQDLEAQIGAPAWSSLIGDTQKAQQSASALGSEAGVQASLGPQATGFDAALVSGAGGQDFRNLSQSYGGQQLGEKLLGANQSASDAWSSLMEDIDRSTAAPGATTNTGTQPTEDLGAAKAKADELKSWLAQNFPPFAFAKDRDSMLAWMNANANASNREMGLQQYWANTIYGKDSRPGMNLVQLMYEDIKKMTPEEFEAFKYGVVPAWMGLGPAASGLGGGGFWGLGNSGQNKITMTATNDTSGLSEEERRDWEQKQAALQAYYTVLAAIAGAG